MSESSGEEIGASFEGILNFRDFGGCRGAGGTLVRGRLFRSAALDRATEDDLDRMAALDIGLVVDLRRWSERQAAPSRRPTVFTGSVVEAIEQDVMEAPHERYLAGNDLSEQVLRERILGFYREAPFDPRHLGLFSRALYAVAEARRPILIHCAAGKDRTGILVALIQTILGVDPEEVMNEYLRSAADRRLVDSLTRRAIAFAAKHGRTLEPRAAEMMTSVRRENLETAFAVIHGRHGSIPNYVRSLGIEDETIEKIRRAYLA